MDQGRVNYEEFYKKYIGYEWIEFLKTGNTKEIIRDSEMVITINSTVGLEAIETYKPVICLGRAFFAIDGIAKQSRIESLAEDIDEVLSQSRDKKLIDNFLNYLKYGYSLEGNLYFFNKRHVKNICKRILEGN